MLIKKRTTWIITVLKVIISLSANAEIQHWKYLSGSTPAIANENHRSTYKATTVTPFTIPAPSELRIASFNASMHRPKAGELANSLKNGSNTQIQAVAEVIQRAKPDILLLNEFDQIYDEHGNFDREATEASIKNFIVHYLQTAQASDLAAIKYPHFFVSASNTGIPSGLDFNNSGIHKNDPADAYGYGKFRGQYAMVVLSKYPILKERARSFQKFRWMDMPGALLPSDPKDSDGNGDTANYFTQEELAEFRLSSKTHIDVAIRVPGIGLIHILASHPTPPVFDDGTAREYPSRRVADWNGLRNHDEIRFWADYIDPTKSAYIYDDKQWDKKGKKPRKPKGGLKSGERFVILGDLNADPNDGDATFNPIALLLNSPYIDTSLTPSSAGAKEQVKSGSETETKTASFNLRTDYALPSNSGWQMENAWVFWPTSSAVEASILNASDHRMVVIDMKKNK